MVAGYGEQSPSVQRKRAAPPNRPLKTRCAHPYAAILSLVFLAARRRATRPAAAAPKSNTIGGAGTSVPPVDPPDPPLDEDELEDDDELLLDEDDAPLEPDEVPPKDDEVLPPLPPKLDEPPEDELDEDELDDEDEPLEPLEPDEPLEPELPDEPLDPLLPPEPP